MTITAKNKGKEVFANGINGGTIVSLSDFRDLTTRLFRLVDDWSACVDDAERALWLQRATCFYVEFQAAACSTAKERDLEMRRLAEQKYLLLIQPINAVTRAISPLGTTASSSGGIARAARYNKSASRAVRLGRAARSAMRRGYF